MAHIGFKKLSAMLGKKGNANPEAIAASVMRKKYKITDIKKAQANHEPLKESQAKKKG